MTIGERHGEPRAAEANGARAMDLTTAAVLRLLSAGATGSIVMALGEGPLRTKELTERVPGYAPRTIYRYASRLTEIGVIERHEEPGVPSKVVHSLTDPIGLELQELVEGYARTSLSRLPNGEISSHDWGSLALLADLWESGMIEELNSSPRSPTELARGEHDWSFHQVSRRAGLFAIGGFIEELPTVGRRRLYALTDKTRRAMALIAGIGRWRRRHVVPEGMAGISAAEVAGLMRTVLPLVALPGHAGKSFLLEIVPHGEGWAGAEYVWGEIGPDGAVAICVTPPAEAEGSAGGDVTAWVDSILDGSREGLSAKGDARLLDECLRQLHAALWEEQEPYSAPAAPAR